VNTAATFFTIVAFLELLDKGNKKRHRAAQRSQVLATSSISGFNRSVPGGFAYGGSKTATTQMMKQFATLLAPFNIRSNIIAPGSKFWFIYMLKRLLTMGNSISV
jgi:NAD(P)-dependent dehydrogenase (short-subunit alcohol dehydrogenase family)